MSASFSASVLRRILATGGIQQQVPVQTTTIDAAITANTATLTSHTATLATHTAALAALAPFTQTGTAAPASGAHVLGEFVWNTAPTAGGVLGWSCTTAGTPGTWKTVVISA